MRKLIIVDDIDAFQTAILEAPQNVQNDFVGFPVGWYIEDGETRYALAQDPARMPSFYDWISENTPGVEVVANYTEDWSITYDWNWLQSE